MNGEQGSPETAAINSSAPLPDVAKALAGCELITVTYNSEEVLEPFLLSVRASESLPISMTVVDNRSAHQQSVAENAQLMGAKPLLLPENVGYGAAVNAAVRQLPSHITYLAICNPDLQLEPKTLSILLSELEAAPQTAAVGPCILDENDQVYPSARNLPRLGVGIGHALFGSWWPTNPWTRRYRQDRAVQKRPCGWLSGAFLVVRRDAFEAVGGFDPNFFMYFEDVDLGWRLGKLWQLWYLPEARVKHLGARSTRQEPRRMLRTHHDSAAYFLQKRYPHWWQKPLVAALKLGLDVRCRLLLRKLSRNR